MPSYYSHDPSDKDISLAQALPWYECPRRYCWYWQTLSFDWDTPVSQGCRYLRAEHSTNALSPNSACVRSDPSSCIDQYEPREPHLLEDGLDEFAFVDPRRVEYIKQKQAYWKKQRDLIQKQKLEDED